MSRTEENSAQVMEALYKSIEGSIRPTIRPTICRVPESLRKLKPSAYTPHFVSIGPLHQNDPHLAAIQGHKISYLHTLFRRTAKSPEMHEDVLRVCLDAMFKVESDAQTCYGESLKYNDGELANTLLVDGCFILELLFRHENRITDGNDPLFTNNLALGGIRRDLLLLENQIPFFVLEILFELTLQKDKKLSLTQYIHEFFRDMIIFGSEMTQGGGWDHILGFLHNYHRFAGQPECLSVVKYSATQLHRTGVKFKASETKDYIRITFRTSTSTSEEEEEEAMNRGEFDMTRTCEEEEEARNRGISTWNLFSWLGRCNTRRESTSVEEGTCNCRISTPTSSIWNLFSPLFQLRSSACLELPPMRVYDYTELFLRNLIAYEQCVLFVPHYITSYAFLMDALIDSRDDVELLENQGVLQNYLGASEDASDLFNNLCKETIMREFYFSDQWEELLKYCNLYWPQQVALRWSRYSASLKNTYFSNPWSIISLIGALLLFGLTAIQAAYSIKSYQFSLHSTNHT